TGTLILEDNIFVNTGQFALFLGATTIKEIIIKGNSFDVSGANYAGGALSIRTITPHADGTTILIEKNIFKDSKTTDIRVDHNVTEEGKLEIVVSDNSFKTPGTTIYTNTLSGGVMTLF